MGRWAQQQRRGSVQSIADPLPMPAFGDWSHSVEWEDPNQVLYGQLLEEPPAGVDGRQYRWRAHEGEWSLSPIGDAIGTEMTLVAVGTEIHYEVQMRWISTTLPGSPGLWSTSHT